MLTYLRGLVILTLLLPCGLHAATISLPQTGQTGCWDSSGNPVTCSDTGQDGDKLKGLAWPAPRFTNPDGSIPVNGNFAVDQLTGLIWAVDILAPAYGWEEALDTIADMNAAGTFGYTDWRMPNRQELESILDRQEPEALPAGHPFTGYPFGSYIWSSTTVDYSTVILFSQWNMAWTLLLPDGNIYTHLKSKTDSAIWPVRGGQFGNSVISVLPASKDFSADAIGTPVSQQVTIANTAAAGSSKLAINSMVLSGADKGEFSVTAGTCGSFAPVVAAGASCSINVSFTPASIGEKTASLRISGSDVNTPNVDLALTGGVGPVATASVSGGNGVITSTNPIRVASGATASFTLLPNSGYQPSSTVTGTCPVGSFSGLTYTTGAVSSSCSVGFSFENINSATVVVNEGAQYANVRLVNLALTAGPTVQFMSFQVNGKTWSKPEPFSASKQVTLPGINGLATVNVHYLTSLTDPAPVSCSDTITLDTKKPTGKVLINNGEKTTTDTHVTLTLTAVDVTSGVASMRFSNDNVTWSDWEDFAGTRGYDLLPGIGTKKVYVQYQDRAGNISATRSDSIKLVAPLP